jgi:uncharacterized RDD family membrane protein YckC
MSENQELASRWKRLGGQLIDGVIALVLVLPVMFLIGAFDHARLSLVHQLTWLVLGLGVFLAVNGYLLAKSGQTVGKKLVGTRIVDLESRQILPLGKVFGLRVLPLALIAQIPGIGAIFSLVDALFIFRNDKRCVHDLIAGTVVVNA